MSLRSWCLVAALAVGCGAAPTSDEPTTAREKQRREARANGEADGAKQSGGGWRYQGDRDACFFTTGRKCFTTENAACQAARCRSPKKCRTVGAAPATVACK